MHRATWGRERRLRSDDLLVAHSVDAIRAAARVSRSVTAAATNIPVAVRHGYRDRYPMGSQSVDSSTVIDRGNETHDHDDGEGSAQNGSGDEPEFTTDRSGLGAAKDSRVASF